MAIGIIKYGFTTQTIIIKLKKYRDPSRDWFIINVSCISIVLISPENLFMILPVGV